MLKYGVVDGVVYLLKKLVLAAWHREYHGGIPRDSIYERIVGGSVTCVQRYHHIGIVVCVVSNVAEQKLKLGVAKIARNFGAEFYDKAMKQLGR